MISKIEQKQILQICIEEKILEREIDDENEFHYQICPYASKVLLDIFQPKGKEDIIIVQNSTTFPKFHIKKQEEFNPAARTDLFWRLHIRLTESPCEFSFNYIREDAQVTIRENVITGFTVYNKIFADGFSKNYFMKVISEVHKASAFVILTIQKAFGVVEFQYVRKLLTSSSNVLQPLVKKDEE